MLKFLAAMFIIQASFIKKSMGDYVENEYWYKEGKKLLDMQIDSGAFSLIKKRQ